MYQRILVPTDGSKLSAKAARAAMALAELSGAQIMVLRVVPRYPVSYFEGGVSLPLTDIQRIEHEWATQAETRGLKAKALVMRSDLVAESIIAAAKKHKCDLIVMASHGRKGIKRLLLGSETTNVLTHSQVPVMVLR